MTESNRPRAARRASWLLPLALSSLLMALPGAASAAVSLDWTSANAFNSAAPTNTERTWLGHVTNPTPGSGARGTATTADGATITDPDGVDENAVDGLSPRGVDELFTFSYPATSGLIDLREHLGTMDFEGTVSFVSPAPPNGHGFTITVEDPRIVLDGESGGQLFAHGATGATDGGDSYDDSAAVWNLDLSLATWNVHADGTQTLSCLVPSIATAETAFPANYPVGAGPNRTPNTFGSFELRISPGDTATPAPRPDGSCASSPDEPIPGPEGPRGPAGPAGPTGPIAPNGPIGSTGPKGDTGVKGDRGPRGRRGARGLRGKVRRVAGRTQIVRLAKAPFGRGTAVKVDVVRDGRVVASGKVRCRTLRVTTRRAHGMRLDGRYVLKRIGGASRIAINLGWA